MALKKLVRDGKVAVLYSPGFGAGWSTWASDPQMVFDPELAEAVLSGDKDLMLDVARRNFPDAYLGGVDDIEVAWLSEGTAFYIDEYDGSESIRTGDDLCYVA